MPPQSSNRDEPEGESSPLTDPARWERLIEEVRPAAFLVVLASSMSKALREHCAPEDIWQETLVQAWNARHEHRWQGPAAFRGWLFEIARNRIRDAARKLRTDKRGAGRPAARLSDLESGRTSSAGGLPPDSSTPSRILMHAERAEAMRQALAELPPDLEPIVRMHLHEELTMELIAERLGIGVSTAWRRFRKGAELYTKLLEKWSGGAGGGSR